MTPDYYKAHISELSTSWLCPSCHNITFRRSRNDETPVGVKSQNHNSGYTNMSCDDMASLELSSGSPESHNTITYGNLEILFNTKFDNMLTTLTSQLKKEFDKATDTLTCQIQLINNEMSTFNVRLQSLENENIALRSELSTVKEQQKSTSSSELQNTIHQLQTEANDREQDTLLMDVQITGVPEYEGEPLETIVSNISFKLGTPLEERDIVSVMRVGPPRKQETDERPRPRPIVLRLARRAPRDSLLKNAKVKRGTTTADLGLPDHVVGKVRVDERLTKLNRMLLAKALDNRSKLMDWKYVWTKDGRVKARKNDTSKIFTIRSETDIDTIFDTNSTPRPK